MGVIWALFHNVQPRSTADFGRPSFGLMSVAGPYIACVFAGNRGSKQRDNHKDSETTPKSGATPILTIHNESSGQRFLRVINEM